MNLNKILVSLKGKKTYLVTGLMVIYVLIGYSLGKGFDTDLLLQALAMAGIRNSIK